MNDFKRDNNKRRLINPKRLINTFVSVTKEIPPLNRLQVDILPENNHFDISPEFFIKEEEVYHKLSNISTSKSHGPDEIPNWVLKFNAYVLASPVAHQFSMPIFNKRLFRATSGYVEKS